MVDWAIVWGKFVYEFFLLLKTPLLVPEIWWIIAPLIFITLLMILYFGKYARERLGWNTALGNSIVLFFVGIDLLRTIFNYSVPASIWNLALHPIKVLVIIGVMFEGVLLSYTTMKHAVPAKVMFFITSPLPVNLQAYVLTVVVYAGFRPNLYTLAAAVALFIVLFLFLRLVQEVERFAYGYHRKTKRK